MNITLELTEYDQEMLIRALIENWRKGDQQVKDWATDMLLRIDPKAKFLESDYART